MSYDLFFKLGLNTSREQPEIILLKFKNNLITSIQK